MNRDKQKSAAAANFAVSYIELVYFSRRLALLYPCPTSGIISLHLGKIELELIQTQMTQKPMLRAEVYARALRASQNRKEDSV